MAFNGRQVTIDLAGETIVGLRKRDFTINRTYVDITSDDDDGQETVLETPGRERTEFIVSGITKDQRLLGLMYVASVTKKPVTIQLPHNDTSRIIGDFLITQYQGSAETTGAYEFSVNLRSTGRLTHIFGYDLLQEDGSSLLQESGDTILWA